MAMQDQGISPQNNKPKAKKSLINDPVVRSIFYQVVLVAGIVALGLFLFANLRANLERQNIATGFGFLDNAAGFDIGFKLIDYDRSSTYWRVLLVGFLNTFLVASIGIVLATILGFSIGIARLSSNWLIARLATVYVEIIRNIPLLLQMFFWYFGVLALLPSNVKQSIMLPLDMVLNKRGFYYPRPLWDIPNIIPTGLIEGLASTGGWLVPIAVGAWGVWIVVKKYMAKQLTLITQEAMIGLLILAVATVILFAVPDWWLQTVVRNILNSLNLVVMAIIAAACAVAYLRKWAAKKLSDTGERFPVGRASIGIMVIFPLLVWFITFSKLDFEIPVLQGFNFKGGVQIPPELIAVGIALVMYTASFIAEVVRAGILAVDRGQTEAAQALGLQDGDRLRLVVIPQAMRVIIPPLTNQFLNLTKNSTLAIFIGYPELAAVFTGTTLNQTGQAVEVMVMTMVIYLTLSLLTSAYMNWYNAQNALIER